MQISNRKEGSYKDPRDRETAKFVKELQGGGEDVFWPESWPERAKR